MSLQFHLTAGPKARIEAAIRAAYPLEACGFLLGSKSVERVLVREILPARNVSTDPHHSFLVSSSALLEAQDFATQNSLEIVGLYHSHPDQPAQPSQKDLIHAVPWWCYLIVSVEATGCREQACFRWCEPGSFEELPIQIDLEPDNNCYT